LSFQPKFVIPTKSYCHSDRSLTFPKGTAGGVEEPAVQLYLASNISTTVLLKKYLNESNVPAVFMIEVKRLVAGEAVLNEAATMPRSPDRSQDCSPDRTQDDALADLVRQHSRLVYRISYAALRSHHDAEDATQEVFLRVLRYSHKLAAVEDPKTWLARIAWRVAVDRSKRRGSHREISLDDPDRPGEQVPSSDSPADQAMQGSQIGARLERLIAALPEKLREPLILSAIEEMSPREIAATLRINEAAVRSRVFRARQILKEKLAQGVDKPWK
jgi:RNA polymerase sigma-70 factor, ECF subfamily